MSMTSSLTTSTSPQPQQFCTMKHPTEKKRSLSKDDDDDDRKEIEEQQQDEDRKQQPQYRQMAIYGEHKRAVSSVKVAPSRLCKNHHNNSSYNSNTQRQVMALVASASADGTCKLWDLRGDGVHTNSTATTTTPMDYTDHPETTTTTATDTHEMEADRGEDDAANNPTATISNSSSHRKSTGGSGKKKSKGNPRTLLSAISTCVGHSRGINEVSWNPTCPLLATASDDKTVRLWDAVTADAVVELRGHDNFVFCVDQYHSMVVTGSFDETVKLWDVRTGDCVCTLPAHSDPVTAVSFNRDGTTIASASHDGLLRIWDVATGECLKTIYAAGNPPVASAKYSPNGKYVLAGTLDSTLRLWPVVPSAASTTLLSSSTSPSSSSHHHTSSSSPHHGICTRVFRENDTAAAKAPHFVNTKYSIAADFTCTGDVVVGSETGHVVLFDLQSAQVKQVLQGHDTDAVLAVSAHDSIPLLATGGMAADRKVEFWIQQ